MICLSIVITIFIVFLFFDFLLRVIYYSVLLDSLNRAIATFTRSCAAYCVLTYVLGLFSR